jgi:hypothetical protein
MGTFAVSPMRASASCLGCNLVQLMQAWDNRPYGLHNPVSRRPSRFSSLAVFYFLFGCSLMQLMQAWDNRPYGLHNPVSRRPSRFSSLAVFYFLFGCNLVQLMQAWDNSPYGRSLVLLRSSLRSLGTHVPSGISYGIQLAKRSMGTRMACR